MPDITPLLVGFIVLVAVLVPGGLIADAYDRRDARRRNPRPPHARRVR